MVLNDSTSGINPALDSVNVVVGAGVSGLTIAHSLVNNGEKVVVLERENEVGGLARSFRYNGFTFDIGPHRFHTSIEEINRFIKDVLKSDYLSIGRMSSVHLLNRYHEWPLGFKSILKLPPSILFNAFLDLFRRPAFEGERFDRYIISQYGNTLFKLFFKDYTEKFSFLKSESIHYRWATTGIDRALIDNRIQLDSLIDAIKLVLMPVPVKTLFTYPPSGIRVFSDNLAEEILEFGGMIKLGVEKLQLGFEKNRISTATIDTGETYQVEKLIWTGNLNDLLRLLSYEQEDLKYLPIVLFNVELKKPVLNPNQWIYFQGKEIIFSRVSIPANFSPFMVPEGRGSLCAEVTAENESHDNWNNAESLVDKVLSGLEKVGLMRIQDIVNVHIEHIKDAYPLYELTFPDKKQRVWQKLDNFENLILAGRTGLFWYNNMDHSIENGLDVAKKLLKEGICNR